MLLFCAALIVAACFSAEHEGLDFYGGFFGILCLCAGIFVRKVIVKLTSKGYLEMLYELIYTKVTNHDGKAKNRRFATPGTEVALTPGSAAGDVEMTAQRSRASSAMTKNGAPSEFKQPIVYK